MKRNQVNSSLYLLEERMNTTFGVEISPGQLKGKARLKRNGMLSRQRSSMRTHRGSASPAKLSKPTDGDHDNCLIKKRRDLATRRERLKEAFGAFCANNQPPLSEP